MNTNSPSSSSFFDSNLDPNSFVFTPPKLLHRHHLALKPLSTVQTTCKNLNNGTSLEGTFKLQGHLLAYYKSAENTTPEQVLDILNARVKTSKSSKYIVQLTKCQITFELSFINKGIAVDFLDCLRNICVFLALEDKYMSLRFFDQYPFSSSFVGKNKADSEIYAIKRFHKQKLLELNSDANARLIDQIAMLRYLSHPNITPLHEVFETSSAVYFTKQYNPHETLDFILKRSNLQFTNFEFQTAKILEAILLSLDYLASEGATFRTLNLTL